jgi:hypothetical protein
MKRKEPLVPLTFDTGITVQIRRTSPMLIQEVQKSFPAPLPPRNKVDYGNGFTAMEVNKEDPDYQEEMKKYKADLDARVLKAMIIRCVEAEIDQTALVELREQMREVGAELDKNDKYVYVSMIAMETADDFTNLANTILKRSQPTEEAVQDAVDSFRGDVQGDRYIQPENTEERSDVFAAV